MVHSDVRVRVAARLGAGVARLVLVTALAAAPSAAQSAMLQLGSLYDTARLTSPRIQAAEAQARARAAQALTVTRPPDPRVQLGLMNRELPGFAPMDPLGMSQLQVMQMLPTAGKLGLAAEVARVRATGVAFQAAEVAWEVRAGVAAAFYELYRVERAVGIAFETRRRSASALSASACSAVATKTICAGYCPGAAVWDAMGLAFRLGGAVHST